MNMVMGRGMAIVESRFRVSRQKEERLLYRVNFNDKGRKA
jgi:hypothetical protein